MYAAVLQKASRGCKAVVAGQGVCMLWPMLVNAVIHRYTAHPAQRSRRQMPAAVLPAQGVHLQRALPLLLNRLCTRMCGG
jgi:hypothetical protein